MVIYRKYRANSFAELRGQKFLKDLLINAVSLDKLSHAYLFCGPRGTGKTSTARILAKAINCLNFSSDVCNVCANCELINSGSSLDIIELDAASNRGIDEIRELKESINYLPTNLKYKIYIIDEVHMLTKEAFNALLKTLEEPPSHVIFILATTEPNKIPMTILSRVSRFDFGLGSRDDLGDKITYILNSENIIFENEILDLIYDFSGGSFRDAESLLGKLLDMGKTELRYAEITTILGVVDDELFANLTNSLLNKNALEALGIIELIKEKQSNLGNLIEQYVNYLNKTIVNKINKTEGCSEILAILNKFIELKSDLKDFDNQILVLKSKVLEICQKNGYENKPNEVKADLPKVSSIKKEESSNQDSPNQNVRAVSNNPTSDHKSKIIHYFKNESANPRLAAILEGSELIVENDSIIIKNKYKFNTNFLDKADNKGLIVGFFKRIGFDSIIVRILLDDSVSNSDSTQSESINISNLAKIQPEPVQETPIDEDNTDLVEELLS